MQIHVNKNKKGPSYDKPIDSKLLPLPVGKKLP